MLHVSPPSFAPRHHLLPLQPGMPAPHQHLSLKSPPFSPCNSRRRDLSCNQNTKVAPFLRSKSCRREPKESTSLFNLALVESQRRLLCTLLALKHRPRPKSTPNPHFQRYQTARLLPKSSKSSLWNSQCYCILKSSSLQLYIEMSRSRWPLRIIVASLSNAKVERSET